MCTFEILKGRNTSFIHTVILNTVTRKFVVDFLIISLILVPLVDDVNLFLALFSIKNKKIPGNNQGLKLSFFSFRFSWENLFPILLMHWTRSDFCHLRTSQPLQPQRNCQLRSKLIRRTTSFMLLILALVWQKMIWSKTWVPLPSQEQASFSRRWRWEFFCTSF